MNTKNTLILLLIALAVLGAIYYQAQKEEADFSSAAIPETTIPAIATQSAQRIRIQKPGQPELVLTESSGQWYANIEKKYEADEVAVNAALKAVSEAIPATVVSSNPDSYEEYQVSDTTATKVEILKRGEDKPSLALLIGKQGPSAFSTYVRLPGQKDVLNAKANLAMTFNPAEGWRQRQIFEFSGPNATRIELEGTSATFTLAHHGDDQWKFVGTQTGEAEQARVMSLSNMLSSLRADSFVDLTSTQTLASLGLQPPRQTVIVHYDDKSTSPSKPATATLLIGNPVAGSDTWYAKRNDKPDVFTIGNHVADALLPSIETIKVPEPAAPPATNNDGATTAGATLAPDPAASAPVAVPPAPAVDHAATTASAGVGTTASLPGAAPLPATQFIDHGTTTAQAM